MYMNNFQTRAEDWILKEIKIRGLNPCFNLFVKYEHCELFFRHPQNVLHRDYNEMTCM